MGNNNLIYSIKNAKVYFCIFAVFMAVLIKSDTFAATIHSAEYLEANDVSQDIDYGSDYKNIMAAFKEDGMVKLYEGESYYIDKTIMLQDDWSFDATGATIYRDGVLFSHEITKTGYGSLNNVTLKGGTYLSTLKNGYNKTFIHFTHAKNINIEDVGSLKVYARSTSPQDIYLDFGDSSEDIYSKSTLIVPEGTREIYISTGGWRNFAKIVEGDVEGVVSTGVQDVRQSTHSKSIYNLAGQKVDASYKGIVIQNGKKHILR